MPWKKVGNIRGPEGPPGPPGDPGTPADPADLAPLLARIEELEARVTAIEPPPLEPVPVPRTMLVTEVIEAREDDLRFTVDSGSGYLKADPAGPLYFVQVNDLVIGQRYIPITGEMSSLVGLTWIRTATGQWAALADAFLMQGVLTDNGTYDPTRSTYATTLPGMGLTDVHSLGIGLLFQVDAVGQTLQEYVPPEPDPLVTFRTVALGEAVTITPEDVRFSYPDALEPDPTGAYAIVTLDLPDGDYEVQGYNIENASGRMGFLVFQPNPDDEYFNDYTEIDFPQVDNRFTVSQQYVVDQRATWGDPEQLVHPIVMVIVDGNTHTVTAVEP